MRSKQLIEQLISRNKAKVLFILALCLVAIGSSAYLFSSPKDEAIYATGSNSDALYTKESRVFDVEFGSKSEAERQIVKFASIPEVNENFSPQPLEQIEDNLQKRSLQEKTQEWLNRVFNREDKAEIQFSLTETGIEDTRGDLSKALRHKFEDRVEDSSDEQLDLEIEQLLLDDSNITTQTEIITNEEGEFVINPEVIDRTDIQYRVIEGKGLKEEIIIKKTEGMSSDCLERALSQSVDQIAETCNLPKNKYIFELNLDPEIEVHRTITGTSDAPSGVWYFTDKYGRYLAHIKPLFAVDAAGSRTNNVYLDIDAEQGLMTVTLDLEWLLSSARVYPIIIDPSIVHDTEVEFNAGTTNRLEVTSDPKVQLAYYELSADEHTVGLWHMNEGSDNTCSGGEDVCDGGGLGNDGIFQGTASFSLASKLGDYAVTLDGDSDYIQIANSTPLQVTGDLTLEGWVYPTNIALGRQTIVCKDYEHEYELVMEPDGDLTFYHGNGGWEGINLDNGMRVVEDRWNHIAIVRDAEEGVIKFYLNGVYLGAETYSITPTSGPNDVMIGSRFGSSLYFQGRIDEVQISDSIRTAAEIKSHAGHRPYGIYTSEVLDLGEDLSTIDDLQWSENGVATGDGETVYDDTDLVAQWNFNEASGTSVNNDAEGSSCGGTPSNCDGTLTNFFDTSGRDQVAGSGWTEDNKRWGDGALMFDGSNDYVDASDSSAITGTGAFSVSAWIKTNGGAGQQTIIQQRSAAVYNGEYMLWVNANGTVYWGTYGDGSFGFEFSSNSPVDDGVWHYIVGVRESDGTGKIYIDGALDSSQSATSRTLVATNVYIGADVRASTNYFDGVIDTISIYNRALAEDEILANSQTGQIEFQTRTGTDDTPYDGGWEDWKPITSETQPLDFDSHFLNTTDTGLISYWAMDETSNNNSCNSGIYDVCDIKDDHGGNVNNDEALIVDGVFGKARGFDGGDDWVIIQGHSDFDVTNITLEAWIYLDGDVGNTQRGIINRQQDNEHAWGLMMFGNGYGGATGNEAVFMVSNGSTWNNCSSDEVDLDPYKWYHVVGTHDGINQKVYVNGMLANTCPFAFNLPLISADIQIGTYSGSFLFKGSIDEMRVYDNALSGTTVQQHYIEGIDKYGITSGSIHPSLDENLKIEGMGSLRSTIGAPTVDDHTVALWHLDETNGDLAGNDVFDETTNNNDGEFNGTDLATGVVDGIYGKARDFNGSDDYVEVTDHSSLQLTDNFTIEAWMKPTASTDHGGLGKMTLTQGWGLNYDSVNKFQFYRRAGGAGGGAADSDSTYTDNAWHYVVGVLDNGTGYLYVDGVLQADTFSGTITDSGGPLTIGRLYSNYAYWFDGSIDEVRYSNVVRTPEEIAEAYRMGRDHYLNRTLTSTDLSSKTKIPFWIAGDRPGTYLETTIGESACVNHLADINTVGLWHLEEDSDYCNSGESNCIRDSSSYGNDGTPSSAPYTVQGQIGKGWKFDGSDDSIVIQNSDIDIQTVTLEAWVNIGDITATGQVINITPTGSTYDKKGLQILPDETIRLYGFQGSTYSYIQSPSSYSKWTHIVGVSQAGSNQLYVNGSLVSSNAQTWNSCTTNNTYIAQGLNTSGANTEYLNSIVDEVRISKVARGADEIRQSYEIGRRTHPITIDFGASLDSGNLITGSGDTSFTIDATTKGFSNKGDNLYVGDKIIVKENYGGTEYIAQGTVSTVNILTGAVTVTGWDTGSTFPSLNFALSSNGATATASSSYDGYGGCGPPCAIDGNDTTHWTSDGYYDGWYRGGEYITIDLGESKTFDTIEWVNNHGSDSIPVDYTIKTSVDGNTYDDLISVTGNGENSKSHVFSAVNARYVRMRATEIVDYPTFSLSEVRVFGGGYTANATVFKWQREYFDVRSSLASDRNAVTNLTFRVTDGSEGRTVWLDDMRSAGPYLTDPTATGDVTSTVNRYLQYRTIFTTYDTLVTPWIDNVIVNYSEGVAEPSTDLLMRHGEYFDSGGKQPFWWAE